MSVSIRLSKIGKKNAPAYRIVVAQTKSKRNGKYIDIVGNYNPSDVTTKFELDKKKYQDWIDKGALVTQAVQDLIAGKYKYVKYIPKVKDSKEKKEDKAGSDAEDSVNPDTEPEVAPETEQITEPETEQKIEQADESATE